MRVHTVVYIDGEARAAVSFLLPARLESFLPVGAEALRCTCAACAFPLTEDWLIVRNSIKNKSDLNVKYCLCTLPYYYPHYIISLYAFNYHCMIYTSYTYLILFLFNFRILEFESGKKMSTVVGRFTNENNNKYTYL